MPKFRNYIHPHSTAAVAQSVRALFYVLAELGAILTFGNIQHTCISKAKSASLLRKQQTFTLAVHKNYSYKFLLFYFK